MKTNKIEVQSHNIDSIRIPKYPVVLMTFFGSNSYSPFYLGQIPSPNFILGQIPAPNFILGQFPTTNFILGQFPSTNFILGQIPTANFILGQIPTSQIFGQIPTFLGLIPASPLYLSFDSTVHFVTIIYISFWIYFLKTCLFFVFRSLHMKTGLVD